MSASNAERQRKFQERKRMAQKEQLKKPQLDRLGDFRRPFHEFYNGGARADTFGQLLEEAGFDAPAFDDDRGPLSYTLLELAEADPDDYPDTSLARAQAMIGCLVSAGLELAQIVNRYLRQEIEARLAEAEAADMDDLEARKVALAEVVRLSKTLEHLDGSVRWTFPVWKVEGKLPK